MVQRLTKERLENINSELRKQIKDLEKVIDKCEESFREVNRKYIDLLHTNSIEVHELEEANNNLSRLVDIHFNDSTQKTIEIGKIKADIERLNQIIDGMISIAER